jgi:Domain of unknown function (DUF2014)/Helix-loop-helix DNA-binding domain
MQWDGEEQQAATYQLDLSPPKGSRESRPRSRGAHQSYPVSPSSNSNDDTQPFLSIPKDLYGSSLPPNGPLTPSHCSSSPETLHLPESRLSGETLRNTSSSELSRLHLKRKSSGEHEPITSTGLTTGQQKPVSKKRPHNVIEKRYRANLNEKIAELRQSVPILRNSAKGVKDGEEAEDDVGDQAGSSKLNKASILTKAVEYIRHLELRNKKLDDENLALKRRLLKLEKVLASDGNNTQLRASAFTSENAVEGTTPETDKSPDKQARASKHPPQGLIPVPESMKKLRQNQPQEHYGAVYDTPQEGQKGGRRWPAKLMIGSLAGLMIVDGLSESQEGSDSKAKGLFGIPLEFMDGWWFLRSPKTFIAAFMQYCRSGGVIPLLKGFLALSMLAFIVFAYLFNSKPVEIEQDEKPSRLRRVPSLASPIEVRRQAWSTSMQTLKLPHHSFFPEWFAVTMEWLNCTVCKVLGFSTYSWITGRSGEDELARVKAWDIAIDAQLAGGDPEISRSRLVLSIFASGTLPQSPTRLMLKALHCRVVLWEIGHGGPISRAANTLAIHLADRQWKKAQRLAAESKASDEAGLPAHLAELLRLDCEDVMLDAVLQRAFNLMYDRSVDKAKHGTTNSLMDVVIEDHAIRSPLDAIAAWWSSQKLHEALILSLAEDGKHQPLFKSNLDLVLKIAPPLSTAYTRALAIQAVFFPQDRATNAHRVLNALPTSKSNSTFPRLHTPLFIDSSMPLSASAEVSTVLDCATIMLELHGSRRTVEGSASMKRSATTLFATLNLDVKQMSLLSFAPVFYVLSQLLLRNDRAEEQVCRPSDVAQTIQDLAAWARAHQHDGLVAAEDSHRLSMGVVARLDLLCNGIKQHQHHHATKRQGSVCSNDTGYGSLGEMEGT